MGWQKYGDVWVNDETGEISETDPAAPASAPTPAPAAAPAPAAPSPETSPAAAPAKAQGLPSAKPGVTWLPRATPPPEDPIARASLDQESSGGKDKKHPLLLKKDGTPYVAAGGYGQTPDFVRDAIASDPELHKRYPDLLKASDDEISNAVNHDDDLDDAIFHSAFPKVLARQGGDIELARVAWYAGPGNVDRYLRDKALSEKHELPASESKWFADPESGVGPDVERFKANLLKHHALPPEPQTDSAEPPGYQPLYARAGDAPQDLAHFDPEKLTPEERGAEMPGDLELAPRVNPIAAAAGNLRDLAGNVGKSALSFVRPDQAGPASQSAVASAPPQAPPLNGTPGPEAVAAAPREKAAPGDLVTAPTAANGTPGALAPSGPPTLEEQIAAERKRLHDELDSYKGWRRDKAAKLDKMEQDALAGKIDPKHFWSSKSTPQRILAAIALGLGAAGAALTHGQNHALELIQSAIKDDIDAQRAELGKKTTLYSEALKQFGSEDEAYRAAMTLQLHAVDSLNDEMKGLKGAGGKMPEQLVSEVAHKQASIAEVKDLQSRYKDLGIFRGLQSWLPGANGAKDYLNRRSAAIADIVLALSGKQSNEREQQRLEAMLPTEWTTKAAAEQKFQSVLDWYQRQLDALDRVAMHQYGKHAADLSPAEKQEINPLLDGFEDVHAEASE